MPTLHLLCGKIASGKSTLAKTLSDAPGTLFLSENQWLGALFADQMATGADYLRCASKLQSVMAPHIGALLEAGLSIVLDFPANTTAQRQWMRTVIDESGAEHQLHFLDVPDAVCLDRLRARNAEGAHEFAPTEAQFHRFARHFEPPTSDEGFNIIRH